MPGGQPLRLGPFTDGLNTASDPTAIADSELAVCINFELDIDGSYISRPPLEEKAGSGSFTERPIFLCEAVFGNDHYAIASNTNGVFYYIGGSWTLITNTFQAYAAVQYVDKVYLVAMPGSANPGGKWDPSGGFVAVSAIPKGQAAVIYKDRLFIAPGVLSTSNSSRLTFSDNGNFDSWPAPNFIDITPGDGSKLIDLTVYQNSLLLFKNMSSYLLAYETSPTAAALTPISSTIGVSQQFNVLNYENQIYIFHNGWVYEIIGLDFNRLNTKVPFLRDDTAPSSFSETIILSKLEDRLICRYYRNTYVFGLRTRTWSQWESESDTLHYFGPILTIHPTTGSEYYAGSNLQSNESVIKFFNKAEPSTLEKTIAANKTITCRIQTKNHDFAVSHQFKRLWWWGADISTNNDVYGIVTPISFTFVTTWDALEETDWDSLFTWDNPLTTPSTITTVVPTGTGTARRFLKFLKALRFRQINFAVQLTTDGSTVDGPARLFTITAIIESKQAVSKAVN